MAVGVGSSPCGHLCRMSGDGAPHARLLAPIRYPALGRFVFPNAVIPFFGGRKINVMEVIIYIGIALTGLGVCAAYVVRVRACAAAWEVAADRC